MDPRAYRDIRTQSGHTYHTFVSPATDASKHTLLFVHGFPSTAYDWRHQVAFFTKAGYGVIAPDLLGHGGSSKPSNMEHYVPSKVAADLVDILDQFKLTRVVAVGHDWYVEVCVHCRLPEVLTTTPLPPLSLLTVRRGSILVSRLGMYYPTRFAAFAFLASGYCPPLPAFDLKVVLDNQKNLAGSELFGYWLYASFQYISFGRMKSDGLSGILLTTLPRV